MLSDLLIDWYSLIIYPLIYILPAYVANATPVIFGGGNDPIDFKRKIFGKRIFGDNKTIRGAVAGIICGTLLGLIESQFIPYLLTIAFLLSIGTIFGDLVGSLIKRQMGMQSGKSFLIMDQYGFFVFALAFAYPFGNLPALWGLAFLILLTGILHPLMNIIAHALKLKSVPW